MRFNEMEFANTTHSIETGMKAGKAQEVRVACEQFLTVSSLEVRQSICLGDPPCGSVRDAEVENLALANEIVQAAHDFFHWCDPVQMCTQYRSR